MINGFVRDDLESAISLHRYTENDDDIERRPEQPPATGSTRHHTARPSPGSSIIRPKSSTAYLDGLRGLAALLVYNFHHLNWYYTVSGEIWRGWGDRGTYLFATLPFVRLFFNGGNSGVAIFFVLSGYVLGKTPLKILKGDVNKDNNTPLDGPGNKDARRSSCRRYLLAAAARRPFRLYILPIVVSLAVALIMQLPFGLAPKGTWPVPQANLFLELKNWIIELIIALDPFYDHHATHWFPYNLNIWTMPVELKGSMIVFGLIAVFANLTARTKLSISAVLSLVLLFTYQWDMACFMGGLSLVIVDLEDYDGRFLRRLSPRTRNIVFYTIFIVSWYILCQPNGDISVSQNAYGWYYLTQLVPRNYIAGELNRFWQSIGAFSLAFSLRRLRVIQALLLTAPLQYLGKISFAFYFTHFPLLWMFGDRVYRFFGHTKPEMETWFDNKMPMVEVGPVGLSLPFVAAQAIILPVNFVLAAWVTDYVDEPSTRLSKWIVAKIRTSHHK